MSKGKAYTSAGTHSNVSRSTRRLMRQGVTEGEKMLNKQKAWLKGGNPWVTMPNPNREETSRLFIRVRMNDLMKGTAKDLRKFGVKMGGKTS